MHSTGTKRPNIVIYIPLMCILVLISLVSPLTGQQQISPSQIKSLLTCGDSTHALAVNLAANPPVFSCQALATADPVYFSAYTGAATISSATTNYLSIVPNSSQLAAAEATAGSPVPRNTTFASLCTTTASAQPGTGSLVFTLRDNGSSTAITFTIAANAAAGTYCDTAHTVSVTSAHTVDIMVVNNSGSNVAPAQFYSWGATY